MSRYLIVAAMLVAGCEQLKSPQRIHDLEDRMDKLTDEVAALKAGSGSAAGRGAGTGSGSAAGGGSGAEVAAAGSGSAEPGAGSGSAEPGAGSGAAEPAAGGSGADVAGAGSGSAAGPESGADPGAGSGGGSSAGDKTDRALAELRAVVASATQGTRPHAPPAAPAAPAASDAPAAPEGLPTWSYDGKRGPPTWGTLDPAWRACMMGKAQSPVDIEPRAGTASPITFHYKATAATLFDEGHSLQVVMSPGSTIEIDGRAYQLLQIHFHMPSEHAIAGEHYPLEVQLLHQDADGKIVMIGVLYDSGAESKPLGELWSRWPRKVGDQDRLRKPFDPSGLLPETRTVFRYTGSLTTPPCLEGVMWNVMRRAMSDSKAHLDEFARHYPHTARELQALGDRKIE
ncbi:MAG TPA: carbonic anhydrase family protein [Kofleriaceae bacterium]|nr:carbonic anhydrase family protein [Kofleriaceae bacterium]